MQCIIRDTNKNIDYSNYVVKYWLPKTYISIMFNSISPKLTALNTSENSTNIENYINQNNPFNHLNYASEDAYLISHNLDKEKVIEQSIKHVLQNIYDDDLQELIEYFIPLTKTQKEIGVR